MKAKEMKTRIVYSNTNSPYFNLAYEQFLIDDIADDEMAFYLWQNAHTVVIGKHQNAWLEVNTELLENEKGRIARRSSGGGAVYQDMGNVNFTFACASENQDLDRQLNVIIGALKSLGIDAEFSGRNDIVAEGRKFSGNAFFLGRNRYIHHGTLMLDVDTSLMGRYLNVSKKKLESKSVKSVKSRVINLKELAPELSVKKLMVALSMAFEDEYGKALTISEVGEGFDNDKLKALVTEYESWDWIYGRSPNFDYSFENRFAWGGIEFNFLVKDGKIVEAKLYSDAMSTLFIDDLQALFVGVSFDKTSIKSALKAYGEKEEQNSAMTEDISNWISDIEF